MGGALAVVAAAGPEVVTAESLAAATVAADAGLAASAGALAGDVFAGGAGLAGAGDIVTAAELGSQAFPLTAGGVQAGIDWGALGSAAKTGLNVLSTANTVNNLLNSGGGGSSGQRSGAMPTSTSSSSLGGVSGTSGASPKNASATGARTTETDAQGMPILALPQLYNTLTPDNALLDKVIAAEGQAPSYYKYGASDASQSPLSWIEKQHQDEQQAAQEENAQPAYKNATLEAEKSAAQDASDLLRSSGLASKQGYKSGGEAEHVPEFITGKTGHYVEGAGDGQSDSIPAMLADGEYVFDADTVAALGNGSNKAGAEALDKMRQNIRKHKRAASTKRIPPPAKSPLEYLKG